jgi:hypothetical protein
MMEMFAFITMVTIIAIVMNYESSCEKADE